MSDPSRQPARKTEPRTLRLDPSGNVVDAATGQIDHTVVVSGGPAMRMPQVYPPSTVFAWRDWRFSPDRS